MKFRIFAVAFLMFPLDHPNITVNGKLFLPGFGRQRSCSPHVPIPVDRYIDLKECRREVKATRIFKNPDANKRTRQVVIENGYDVETHNVTSQDGYITTLYRVPGKKNSIHGRKPAVLLYHPFASVSDVWIVLPSNKNLVFKLVNAGYEVWLPNGRGTDDSRGHVRLNAESDIEYWNFSFHEMGVYDLPATIEHILKTTGNEKIFFIGHSQGGTVYMIGASEIPKLNNKIHASFLLAPAVHLGSSYHPLMTKALMKIVYTPLEALLYNMLGGHVEIRNPRFLLSDLGLRPVDICSVQLFQCDLCNNVYYIFFDLNPHQVNYTNIANVVKGFDTIAIKQAIHFGQNALACQFRKFDYGRTENLKLYGSIEPPAYQLENVEAPLHIFYGEQDPFITPTDIHKLVGEIKPGVLKGLHRVDDVSFSHNDFILGKGADVVVYDLLIDIMRKY